MGTMPDTIYMRTVTIAGFVTIDIYVPLYKSITRYETCNCGENKQINSVTYTSLPFHYKKTAANDSDLCCQIFSLTGACGTGGADCSWQFSSYNPMLWDWDPNSPEHIETLTVPTDISCGTLSGSFNYTETQGSSGNACVPVTLGVSQDITISTSVPGGGSLASECHNMCCGSPTQLFVTVDAPDCPEIDGQVVTLDFATSYTNPGSGGGTYNTNGTMTIIWQGMLDLPGSCPVPISASVNTWSADTAAKCTWALTIGTSLATCLSEEKSLVGKSYCPPLTFSSTWNPSEYSDCDTPCCNDTEMSTISFDLDT